MTSIFPLYQALVLVVSPLISLLFVAAAIAVLRVDRGHHAWFLLFGSLLLVAVGVFRVLLFAPGFGLVHADGAGSGGWEKVIQMQGGATTLGSLLLGYGVLAQAIVYGRVIREFREFRRGEA